MMEPVVFLLLIAIALFMASVFADRVLSSDTFAQWFFGISGLTLYLSINFLIMNIFFSWDNAPIELGTIDFFRWLVSECGGWSPALAASHFMFASALGIMFLLARFVDAVEPEWYGIGALIGLVSGTVFLVGFFIFFKWLSLILGIVSTIIGIMVGLRKLG